MTESRCCGAFYLIPHTHWEGAVFQTREAYLEMGLPNILRALALLKADPDYRFTLDQVCYVKPFLERYPQEAPAFRRFVNEGRLAIVGGTDTMLDVNMPGGESWVRQVLYGKGYFRRELGVDVTVGWQLDTFGHHAQMPQLLRLSGLRSFWFFRGVPNWDTPGEFLWEGIDGTRIPAFWLPEGYAVSYGSPKTLPEFSAFMQTRYDALGRYSPGPLRAGPGGADVCAPEEHLPGLVREHNARSQDGLQLRLATPLDFEAAVKLGDNAPVVSGELNPIFQGIYSSRIELKQQARRLETLLTTAEKLGALLCALGEPVCDDQVWEAWERVLFNQAHDLMSGVMTDRVYEDTLQSFDFARRIAEKEVETRLRRYCELVNTEGEGQALVVFNALGSARTDVVTATVGFADVGVRALRVLDPDGRPVPVQVTGEERLECGGLVEARIAFIARDVPALGHHVYRILPAEPDDPGAARPGEVGSTGVLESDLYRVEIDPQTGAISSITCKADGREVLRAPGNIVVREEDHGDLWEPYRPLDGGSRIAMKEPHPIPPRGQALYSDEQRGETGNGISGPVFSEFTVAHPFGNEGRFRTTVRVYNGLPRIEVRTELLNDEKFVRYRVIFPTTIASGESVHEIPFGAITRPEGIEFPAQNWVDWSDGKTGLALLNRGLPGNAITEGTLVLSLLRSTCIVAYGFGGGYGPGMSSDTGFELGREMAFDYALVPHSGDWRQAGLAHEGQALNCPLMACSADNHPGRLQACGGFARVAPGNVALSTLKCSYGDAVALRVYEAHGEATEDVRVCLPDGVAKAQEVDLLEDPLGEVQVVEGEARFSLRPFEIKTLRFRLP